MHSIRFLAALAAALSCAMAAPAHTQRVADLAPGAPSYGPPAPAAASPVLSASRDLAPALRPMPVDAPDSAARRLSVGGHAAVGAGVGAVTGALASAAFMLSPECRTGYSMCGLAIPFLVGGGAVAGGAVGLVVGLIRNR